MSKQFSSSMRAWIVAAFALILVIALPAALYACPTCKDQLAGDANSAGILSGYFWSIILMLSMPIVILGSLGAYVFYQLSKADAKVPTIAKPSGSPATKTNDRETVGV